MNIVFWILVLIAGVIAYYILSFAFGVIGSIGEKIWKSFNKNIGKNNKEDKGGNNNE